MKAFHDWTFNSHLFLPDTLEPGTFSRVELRTGQTLIIPSGWIHAVLTPDDSLVFGGNFLHSFALKEQAAILDGEIRTNVQQEMRFPMADELLWCAALRRCPSSVAARRSGRITKQCDDTSASDALGNDGARRPMTTRRWAGCRRTGTGRRADGSEVRSVRTPRGGSGSASAEAVRRVRRGAVGGGPQSLPGLAELTPRQGETASDDTTHVFLFLFFCLFQWRPAKAANTLYSGDGGDGSSDDEFYVPIDPTKPTKVKKGKRAAGGGKRRKVATENGGGGDASSSSPSDRFDASVDGAPFVGQPELAAPPSRRVGRRRRRRPR